MPPLNWKPTWCTCSLLYGEPHLVKSYSTWRRHTERQARLDAGANPTTTLAGTTDDYDAIMADEYGMPEQLEWIPESVVSNDFGDSDLSVIEPVGELEPPEGTFNQLANQQPESESDDEGLEELYLGSQKEGLLDEEVLELELQHGQIDELETVLSIPVGTQSGQAYIYDSTTGQS
jgi:hypothetical protein